MTRYLLVMDILHYSREYGGACLLSTPFVNQSNCYTEVRWPKTAAKDIIYSIHDGGWWMCTRKIAWRGKVKRRDYTANRLCLHRKDSKYSDPSQDRSRLCSLSPGLSPRTRMMVAMTRYIVKHLGSPVSVGLRFRRWSMRRHGRRASWTLGAVM